MGYPFAEQFVSFVESKDLPVKSVAKIAINPDQSKHLETAKTTVLGIELDFVNLRSEEYADDSRIPTGIVSPSCFIDELEFRLRTAISDVRDTTSRRIEEGHHNKRSILQCSFSHRRGFHRTGTS